jgi:hypothetical protein
MKAGAAGGMRMGRGTGSANRKQTSMSLYSLQILLDPETGSKPDVNALSCNALLYLNLQVSSLKPRNGF